MKKLFVWLLVTVFAISIAFMGIGCKKAEEAVAPATEEAEEGVAEETAPAEEEIAEEAVVTEEAEELRLFEGITIWFESGGDPGCCCGTVFANGALAAGIDLGCDVKVMYAGWQPDKMIANFNSAVAASADGIVIMGHPGDDSFEPFVDEAIEKGIIVTCIDTELTKLQEKYKTQGFGYIGGNLYEFGYLLGKEANKRFDLEEGSKAMVWGLKSQPTRGQETIGTIDALEEAGVTVDYIEISSEIDADASLGTSVLVGYLSSNPDVDYIHVDHGAVTTEMGNYLRAAGMEPGEVHATGTNITPGTIESIKDGYLDFTGEQSLFVQGYYSVLQICMTKILNVPGLVTYVGGSYVDKNNIDEAIQMSEKHLR